MKRGKCNKTRMSRVHYMCIFALYVVIVLVAFVVAHATTDTDVYSYNEPYCAQCIDNGHVET